MPEEAKKIFRDKLVVRFKWVDGQLAGHERIAARPAVQEALKAEGLLK